MRRFWAWWDEGGAFPLVYAALGIGVLGLLMAQLAAHDRSVQAQEVMHCNACDCCDKYCPMSKEQVAR